MIIVLASALPTSKNHMPAKSDDFRKAVCAVTNEFYSIPL